MVRFDQLQLVYIAGYCLNFSFNTYYLKRGYIEFKYYADAIHSDLTPPG